MRRAGAILLLVALAAGCSGAPDGDGERREHILFMIGSGRIEEALIATELWATESAPGSPARRHIEFVAHILELIELAHAHPTYGPLVGVPAEYVSWAGQDDLRPDDPWRPAREIAVIADSIATKLARNHDLLDPYPEPGEDPRATLALAEILTTLDQYEQARSLLDRLSPEQEKAWRPRYARFLISLRESVARSARDLDVHREQQTALEALWAEARDDPALREEAPLILYNLSTITRRREDESRTFRYLEEAHAHVANSATSKRFIFSVLSAL